MVELEQKINQQNPTEAAGNIESKPITDEEIIEANELFKSGQDEARLALLKAKREEEFNQHIPVISREIIAGLKGTSDERDRQFELANNYFKSIIEKRKNGTLDNFALEVERLQNWDKSPIQVKEDFKIIYNNKKNKFSELIKEVKSVRNVRFESGKNWNNFLEEAKLGKDISKEKMARFEKDIKIQQLQLMNYIPDYRGEAAIYLPIKFAEECIIDLNLAYRNVAKNRRGLREGIEYHRERIKQFEGVKNRRVA